ncbi:enoyl-CoA hydratase/isomerase family protein, partial [Streptomyces sp. NPDC054949]
LLADRIRFDPTVRVVLLRADGLAFRAGIDAYADAALPAALDGVAMTAALTLTSEDAREGYAAQAARRPPHFTGG